MVRVLAIDGGGIRGIIPATVLADLELRAGRPVAELFDLIAGTSTGGILALALTAPGEDGRPRFRAHELPGLYAQEGPEIFHRSVFHRIRSGGGTLDERYPSDGLRRVLGRYFGELRLSQALAEVLITAYETEGRRPFFFRRSGARQEAAADFPMRDVAHATSAAPTYFEAVRLGELSLIDGGVFAVNPAMCALAEVVARGGEQEDVLMVSLGTGTLNRPLPWKQIRDWGRLEWAQPVIDVIFDGISDTVDFQAREILGEGYWRLQTELRRASDDLDDARPGNLAALQAEAADLVEREAATLAQIADALRRSGGP
jgi:patatin-like phospholipase/acyl hydrolase